MFFAYSCVLAVAVELTRENPRRPISTPANANAAKSVYLSISLVCCDWASFSLDDNGAGSSRGVNERVRRIPHEKLCEL